AAPRTRWRWAVPVAISASLIVVAALDVRMGDWLFPRRSLAGGGHRNVVLVVLDTVRYDDALGSAPAMPNLERFARNGLAFDQAWAAVPWTVPSHFAMLSGTDPWRLPFNRMERRFTKTMTLAPQRFRSAGYATASVSGNPLLSSEVGFGAGFDELSVSRGAGVCRSAIGDLLSRLWVHDLPRSPVCGWYIASEVTDRALRFVRRARRPYFLMLNYMDAHDPYYVPPECEEEWRVRFPRAAREAWVNATHRDAELRRRTHDRYRAAMRCLDRSVGRLLDALEADSDAATTTIVIAGDHGEQFAERGLIGHGNSVYPEALRVPLVIRGPDVPGGRIGDPVSLTDLHTVLLQILHPRRLGGPLRLLDPHRRRQPVVAYFAAIHPRPSAAFSVISSEAQYIRWNDGRETLLDTESGAPLPLEAVPDLVSPARALAIRETRTATKANAFDGLGYLQ
ncbi:MAG TPA: sulfatase, partial [Thermoanaerobaculia bacterium]|nr:sulfatase [Thermoanaerobaculia bacterium]